MSTIGPISFETTRRECPLCKGSGGTPTTMFVMVNEPSPSGGSTSRRAPVLIECCLCSGTGKQKLEKPVPAGIGVAFERCVEDAFNAAKVLP